MAELSRFIKAGAIISEDFSSPDSLCDLKNRGWTVSGNPQSVSGGISFDASGDWLTKGGNYGQVTTTEITVYAKFKLNGTGQHCILGKGNPNLATDRGYQLTYRGDFSPNTLNFQLYHPFTVVGFEVGDDLEDGNVHDVMITVSGTTYNMYLDGSLYDTQTSNAITSLVSNTDFRFGAQNDNGRPFNGILYSAMVFDRALSSQEVTDLMNGTTFDYDKYLVASYDMSTPNPRDMTGNGNDATGVNIDGSNIVDGVNSLNCGLSFNGSDEYVALNNNFDFNGSDNKFSVVLSAKIDDFGDSEPLFEQRDANDDGVRFATSNAGGGKKLQLSVNTVDVGFVNTYNTNQWYVLGFSCDLSDIATIYADGDAKESGDVSSVTIATTTNAFIGTNFAQAFFLDGTVGTVLIYNNKALTTIQHKDIANRINEGRLQ